MLDEIEPRSTAPSSPWGSEILRLSHRLSAKGAAPDEPNHTFFSVFQPEKKDAKSVDAMRRLAKAIGRDVDCDRLMDEWKLFLMDDNVSTEAVVSVDQYWANVFKEKNSQGEPKYKQLGNLGKKVLSLSHGNSEVEGPSPSVGTM